MIEISNLCAGYDGVERLHDINLLFKHGEITVIIGPNGCGKSTLIKAISRIIPCTSGKIALFGREVTTFDRNELARTIAVMPQMRSVPSITVERMVLHGRFPYLGYPRHYRKADYEIVDTAINEMDLGAFKHRNVDSLSGGERQKVYIAMILSQQTPIVLLDEPTTFLDISYQLQIIDIAKYLQSEGKTVIMVAHDLNLALRCANTAVLMKEGRVLACESPIKIVESGLIDQVFHVKSHLCRNDSEDIFVNFT